MILHKNIDSLEATQQLAQKIAHNLKGGEVIELAADVGAGKTTFTKYLVAALGSNDVVSSPTFTVSKTYNTLKNTIYHYDFYRLNDPQYVQQALAENVHDTNDITIIEWGGLVDGALPVDRIKISIIKHPTNERARTIIVQTTDTNAYVLKDIK